VQGSGVRGRRDPSHEARSEDRPPQRMVGGLVDEYVLLAGKEPGEGAGGEFVPTLAQQVGGPAPHHQVELQLGVAVGAGAQVAGRVSNHPSIDASPKAQILDHRKKR
jgi:hypothetical protein